MIAMWWALGGCPSAPAPDPTLIAQRDAVRAWRRGAAELEAGDAEAAEQAFAQARQTLDAPLLAAWQAKASADAGRVDDAVAALEAALRDAPGLAVARYNRAAYLVRLGRVEEAGPELQRALADGAADPLSVFEDPDFAQVLGHPALAFLPSAPLVAQVDALPPSSFLGSDIDVTLTVEGLVREPVRVVVDEAVGPLELVKVVEDRRGGDRERRWTWTFRVVGAGDVRLGPFRVTAGPPDAAPLQADAASVQMRASAPPDRIVPDISPAFREPRELLSTSGGPGPWAHQVGSELRVGTGLRDRVKTVPPIPKPVRVEVLGPGPEDGVAVHVYTSAASVRQVQVTAPDGTGRFDGPPQVVEAQPHR